jgi:hypothetical protein
MGIPSDDESQARLTRMMASKLSAYPDSMSWIIERYKEIEKADDAEVQRRLGISDNDYYHLAVCGRPRSDLFALDIEILAERFNIEQARLANLIRRVDSITTFRNYSEVASSGMVAAARDVAEEQEDYDATPDNCGAPPSKPDIEQ